MALAAPPTPRTWTDTWIAPALVAAVVVAVFLPSLFGGFVWDDLRFIVDNPKVLNPGSWLDFLRDAGTADPTSPQGILRPLRTLEFAVDHSLFGLSPFAFHVHSLLWHVASATLLLFVLRRLLGDSRAAFAATLLWAVHPVHVESVAWISSRGDVAVGACSLAAVLFALRTKGFDRDLVFSSAAAALAPLYKETGVVLFIVIAVLRWTNLSRAPVWPYAIVSIAYLLYRHKAQSQQSMDVTFVLGGSVAGTFATMIRAFGFYIVETLLPSQSLDWYMTPSTSFADFAVIAWLCVHAALVTSAVVVRERAPRWTLAVGWFYAFLLLVSNCPLPSFLPSIFLGITTTERFLYLPLVGVALALGCALVRAMRAGGTTPSSRGSHAGRAAWTAALVAVTALGVTSVARAGLWRDEEAMQRGVLADHESPRSRQFAGVLNEREALVLRAQAYAMSAGPELDATVLRVRRLLETALDDEHRALDEWYAFEMTPHSRGVLAMHAEFEASNICYLLNRPEEALFHAEEALRIHDDVRPEPHYDRAIPLLALGFAPQAMRSMRQARAYGFLEPRPDIGGFFLQAADACERDGLYEEAAAGFTTAVDACPEGPLRDAAKQRLAAVKARTPAPGDADRESKKIAELDAALAELPRSCPVRRDHSISK